VSDAVHIRWRPSPPAAEGDGHPAGGDWSSLPPIARAAASHELTTQTRSWLSSLAGRRAPLLALAPLRHDVSLHAPAGQAVGIARVVASRRDGPPLALRLRTVARRVVGAADSWSRQVTPEFTPELPLGAADEAPVAAAGSRVDSPSEPSEVAGEADPPVPRAEPLPEARSARPAVPPSQDLPAARSVRALRSLPARAAALTRSLTRAEPLLRARATQQPELARAPEPPQPVGPPAPALSPEVPTTAPPTFRDTADANAAAPPPRRFRVQRLWRAAEAKSPAVETPPAEQVARPASAPVPAEPSAPPPPEVSGAAPPVTAPAVPPVAATPTRPVARGLGAPLPSPRAVAPRERGSAPDSPAPGARALQAHRPSGLGAPLPTPDREPATPADAPAARPEPPAARAPVASRDARIEEAVEATAPAAEPPPAEFAAAARVAAPDATEPPAPLVGAREPRAPFVSAPDVAGSERAPARADAPLPPVAGVARGGIRSAADPAAVPAARTQPPKVEERTVAVWPQAAPGAPARAARTVPAAAEALSDRTPDAAGGGAPESSGPVAAPRTPSGTGASSPASATPSAREPRALPSERAQVATRRGRGSPADAPATAPALPGETTSVARAPLPPLGTPGPRTGAPGSAGTAPASVPAAPTAPSDRDPAAGSPGPAAAVGRRQAPVAARAPLPPLGVPGSRTRAPGSAGTAPASVPAAPTARSDRDPAAGSLGPAAAAAGGRQAPVVAARAPLAEPAPPASPAARQGPPPAAPAPSFVSPAAAAERAPVPIAGARSVDGNAAPREPETAATVGEPPRSAVARTRAARPPGRALARTAAPERGRAARPAAPTAARAATAALPAPAVALRGPVTDESVSESSSPFVATPGKGAPDARNVTAARPAAVAAVRSWEPPDAPAARRGDTGLVGRRQAGVSSVAPMPAATLLRSVAPGPSADRLLGPSPHAAAPLAAPPLRAAAPRPVAAAPADAPAPSFAPPPVPAAVVARAPASDGAMIVARRVTAPGPPPVAAAPPAGAVQRTLEDSLPSLFAVNADPADLDELVNRIYLRIRNRLRAELLVDRERAGLIADLR
jgi:hypothetical protein